LVPYRRAAWVSQALEYRKTEAASLAIPTLISYTSVL
jgi:hypothetical protein